MASAFTIDPVTGQPAGQAKKQVTTLPPGSGSPVSPTAPADTSDPFSAALTSGSAGPPPLPPPPPAKAVTTTTTGTTPTGQTAVPIPGANPAPTGPQPAQSNSGTGGIADVTFTAAPGQPITDPLQLFSGFLSLYPGNPQGAIDAYNARYPDSPLKPAYEPGSNTIGVSGQSFAYLVAPGTGQNTGTTWQTGGTPGASTTTTDPSAGPINPATIPAVAQAIDPQLEAAITQLLAEGNAPVTASDPIIASQTQDYKNQQTQATQQAREQLAAQSAYEGVPTSSFDTQIAQNQATAGTNTANYQAGLISSELTARRAEVVDAMQFAQGSDAQALQLELDNIDSQLAAQGQANQVGEYNAGLEAALQQALSGGA